MADSFSIPDQMEGLEEAETAGVSSQPSSSFNGEVPSGGSESRSSILKVETTTWTRDSHDLFDYETPHVNAKRFYMKDQAKMYRRGIEVQLCEDDRLRNESLDHILSVKNKDGKFQICPAERNGINTTAPKKLWLIVREMERGYHILQDGDLIKLGRFKLKVRQLVKEGDTTPELRLDESDVPTAQRPSENLPEKAQCRICLLEEETPEDPFVSPCHCKGTIGCIHIECLRHWINGRLNLGSSKSAVFYRQLQCELCKCTFPSAVEHNGMRLKTVTSIPVIEPPFVVLENFGASNKGLHILSMADQKSHKLGRGHESDVRIPDVSISRCHAMIKFYNGNFLLEDHNSKFGTLVALRKASFIEKAHKLALQVGRTIINFSLSENSEVTFSDESIVEAQSDAHAAEEADGNMQFDTRMMEGYPPDAHEPPRPRVANVECEPGQNNIEPGHNNIGRSGPRFMPHVTPTAMFEELPAPEGRAFDITPPDPTNLMHSPTFFDRRDVPATRTFQQRAFEGMFAEDQSGARSFATWTGARSTSPTGMALPQPDHTSMSSPADPDHPADPSNSSALLSRFVLWSRTPQSNCNDMPGGNSPASPERIGSSTAPAGGRSVPRTEGN